MIKLPTLTILRGISGSGKSTWTKNNIGYSVVVNRDSLRTALFGTCEQDYYASEMLSRNEGIISLAAERIAHFAMLEGRDIISDNTNVSDRIVSDQIAAAKARNYEVRVIEFNCPVPVAIKSVAHRAAQQGGLMVPQHVIENQRDMLSRTRIEPDEVVRRGR